MRVDPDRIALFGRSMGGGVMMKALAAEPGLFAAGVGWASVSSLEAENFDQFQRPDAPLAELKADFRGRHGLPGRGPGVLAGRLAAAALRRHHRAGADGARPLRRHLPARRGRAPPSARMTQAGVDATLEWYDDGHAFGPAFIAAMDRTVRFLDARMPA